MKKVSFYQVADWERVYLEKNGWLRDPNFIVTLHNEWLSPEQATLEPETQILSIFVDSPVTAEVLTKFPQLELVATRSTGYDHIDLVACRARGVAVVNVPAYGEHTVAEYAFALILTLSRKIFDSFDRIKETGSFNLDGLRGFDLRDKTLGVVGAGRIGRQVIAIAKGFQMRVVACDAHPDTALAEHLGFVYAPLEEVLKQSDVITLHVPQIPETHHLINEQTLALMKPTAYLINTSRGTVIDTSALVKVLKDKKLAGAGLDVLEEEGIIKDELSFLTKPRGTGAEPDGTNADLRTVIADHVLIDLPNVIVTPHNAFNTTEALERIIQTTLDNIRQFAAGTPVNFVN